MEKRLFTEDSNRKLRPPPQSEKLPEKQMSGIQISRSLTIIFQLYGPTVSLIPTKQYLNKSKRHHQVCQRFLFCMYLHTSPGSFLRRSPLEASPPYSTDQFYMCILREFGTNWKLKEMKGNDSLVHFILLRRQHISSCILQQENNLRGRTIPNFTMHPNDPMQAYLPSSCQTDTY